MNRDKVPVSFLADTALRFLPGGDDGALRGAVTISPTAPAEVLLALARERLARTQDVVNLVLNLVRPKEEPLLAALVSSVDPLIQETAILLDQVMARTSTAADGEQKGGAA